MDNLKRVFVGYVLQDEYGWFLGVNGFFVCEKLDGSVKIFKTDEDVRLYCKNNYNELSPTIHMKRITKPIYNQ